MRHTVGVDNMGNAIRVSVRDGFLVMETDEDDYIFTPAQLRILYEALGRALAEVDSQPAKETA